MSRFALFTTLFVVLSACGIIVKDRSSEYIEAEVGSSITIPEGLSDLKISPAYPIPDINNQRVLSDDYELPKPPNATAALDKDTFIVESVGDQTWLRLYMPPGKVWPLLDVFWAEHGINVAKQNIREGLMVSEPIAADAKVLGIMGGHASLPKSPLLQARLLQGVRRSTAELQLGILASNSTESDLGWQKSLPYPSEETALLNKIGEFITSKDLQNRHSLLANGIGGKPKVSLHQDENGDSYLQLDLSLLRSWSEVGKALKSAGVIVSDLDQSEGKYFVSYLSEDGLDSWFTSEEAKKEKLAERNLVLVISPLQEGASNQYQVRVEVLNEEIEASLGKELLVLVFEHIS